MGNKNREKKEDDNVRHSCHGNRREDVHLLFLLHFLLKDPSNFMIKIHSF